MTGTELSWGGIWDILFSQLSQYFIFFLLFVFLLWAATVVRVLKDSLARSNNIFFHILSVLLVTFLTPILGLPLYLAIRPIYYHPSRYFGRTVLFALATRCPQCSAYNERKNAHCTQCGCTLLITCHHCHTKTSYEDTFCPQCGVTIEWEVSKNREKKTHTVSKKVMS